MTAPAPSTSRWSGSFLLSSLLHGLIVVLLFLLNYLGSPSDADQPKVFELVAGEGDNFAATEAPALGTPGGVKLDLPAPPSPKFEAPKFEPPTPQPEPPAPTPPPPQPTPAPPEPTPAPPVPVEPAPVPVPAPKPAPAKAEKAPVPDMAKKLRRDVIRAESKAKQQVAKERAVEEKRAADEKKRMTKAEFDARNKGKADPSAKASSKVAHVDAEGIAKGVRGGSTANTTGGAGGKAMTSSSDEVLGAYFEMFKLRLREQFELPPGVSDSLKAGVEFQIAANGSIGGVRITRTSGSAEFDRAVLDAIRRVRMPARPDKRSETVAFVFTLRDRNNEG